MYAVMLLSGVLFVLGAVLVVFGLILCTDGVEAWHRRRAKPPEIPPVVPSVRERGVMVERTVRTRIITAERIR